MPSLSALSPFGPIFGKELRTTARRKRTYILRVAYLAGLLLLLILAYTGTSRSGTRSVAQRQSEQAEMGEVFFVCFSMFCVISMALIGPVLTATAISSERAQKTLHVLLMTPINSWQIISGKLFSRLLAALTLIGLSLPALAVARLLGGVELDQMFEVICLCTVTALSSAAIGLFYSTLMTRAYAVILLSYATLAFMYLFVPFMLIAVMANTMRASGGGKPMVAFEITAALAPPWSVALVISKQRMLGAYTWVPCVVVSLMLTALLVVLCGVVLRRIARTALSYASARASATRTVGDNPVLWRELRRPLMTRRWQAILGTIICLLLLVLSYAGLESINRGGLDQRDSQIGYAFTFNAMLMLLVCVVSATAIAGEKESDTWTLLLATPLSASEIVRGKFLGLLRRMMWPWVLIVAHFTLFTVTGILSVEAFLVILWVMFSFNLIWVATGLYLSLRLKHVTFAVILNLLLPVMVYPLVLALLAVLAWLLDANSDRWMELVGWYAPYPYLASAIDGLRGSTANGSLWLPEMRQHSHRVTPGEFEVVVFVVGIIYLASTSLILWLTVSRFDRIVGRSPQAKQRGVVPIAAGIGPAGA